MSPADWHANDAETSLMLDFDMDMVWSERFAEAEREARGIEFLPRNPIEAAGAFAGDPFVEQTFGGELRDEFIRYKVNEWQACHQTISARDVERYIHLF